MATVRWTYVFYESGLLSINVLYPPPPGPPPLPTPAPPPPPPPPCPQPWCSKSLPPGDFERLLFRWRLARPSRAQRPVESSVGMTDVPTRQGWRTSRASRIQVRSTEVAVTGRCSPRIVLLAAPALRASTRLIHVFWVRASHAAGRRIARRQLASPPPLPPPPSLSLSVPPVPPCAAAVAALCASEVCSINGDFRARCALRNQMP